MLSNVGSQGLVGHPKQQKKKTDFSLFFFNSPQSHQMLKLSVGLHILTDI